jgi:hypothetical protein
MARRFVFLPGRRQQKWRIFRELIWSALAPFTGLSAALESPQRPITDDGN